MHRSYKKIGRGLPRDNRGRRYRPAGHKKSAFFKTCHHKYQTPEIIDEVVGSHEVKSAQNHHAIAFMAEVLKKRLELGILDNELEPSGES